MTRESEINLILGMLWSLCGKFEKHFNKRDKEVFDMAESAIDRLFYQNKDKDNG